MYIKMILVTVVVLFNLETNAQPLSILSTSSGDSLNNSPVYLTPLSNLGNNIAESFTGVDNILLQAAGILSTAALSTSNIDNHVSTYFRDHTSYSQYARPAVIVGSTLPLTAGAFLYLYGRISDDNRMVGASFAVLQAGLITLGYISLLKAITAREHPDPNDAPLDRGTVSRTFRFGFFRGGIFHGWPSGHVGGAMSVASSLSSYYPDKLWLKILTYGWTAYTMASVSVSHKGTMHWLSDAVAAGFMTYSIGHSVGNFYRSAAAANEDSVRFRFWPIVNSDYSGLYFSYSF